MKTNMVSIVVTLLVALSLLILPVSFPREAAAQISTGSASGELIVGFNTGIAQATARGTLDQVVLKIGLIKRSSTDVQRLLPKAEQAVFAQSPQSFLVKINDASPEGMAKAISQFKAIRGVKFVEPNGICSIPESQMPRTSIETKSRNEYQTQYLTSDPMILEQWGYFYIGGILIPVPPTTAPTIAIVDTGVDYTHPDLLLNTKVIKGPDIVNGDLDPMDDNGHGTHCAGIAAALSNNDKFIVGVSPTSKIYAVKVLNSQGWGTWYDIGTGILAAANRTDVKVISLSLGGTGYSAYLDTCTAYAVNTKGKLVCAAAGNTGVSAYHYPAAFSITYPNKCLSVAASDNLSYKADFSNWSEYGDWVNIAAPGTDILSTLPMLLYPTGWGVWSGTSMATPFVAGAAARVWAKNPTWTNAQVGTQLVNTGRVVDPASLGDPTLDPTLWPTSVDTFPWILNLYNALGGVAPTGIYGRVINAVTSNAIAGAKVTMTRTSPATPAFKQYDYVMANGEFLVNNLIDGTYKITIAKTGYATINLLGIVITSGLVVNIGVIPVAPSIPGARWHVAVYWNGLGDGNDLYGWLPAATPDYIYFDYPGAMTISPWARWNLDSWATGFPLQSISLARTLAGTYTFGLYNYDGTSTAMAWVYYGATLKAIVISPALNVGDWWYIGQVRGTIWTTVNSIGGYPGPYGVTVAGIDTVTGRMEVNSESSPTERPGIPENEPVSPRP